MYKNKKIIKKIENIEKIEKNFIYKDRKRKEFNNRNLRNNFVPRGKFKKRYNPKAKTKRMFEEKKYANY